MFAEWCASLFELRPQQYQIHRQLFFSNDVLLFFVRDNLFTAAFLGVCC